MPSASSPISRYGVRRAGKTLPHNARPEPRPEAGAQRTLEAVTCTPGFGGVSRMMPMPGTALVFCHPLDLDKLRAYRDALPCLSARMLGVPRLLPQRRPCPRWRLRERRQGHPSVYKLPLSVDVVHVVEVLHCSVPHTLIGVRV